MKTVDEGRLIICAASLQSAAVSMVLNMGGQPPLVHSTYSLPPKPFTTTKHSTPRKSRKIILKRNELRDEKEIFMKFFTAQKYSATDEVKGIANALVVTMQ